MGLMGASAFAGCAPAIPSAQMGDDPFEGGIGGTGIVGLMTGTGSVLVNGLRIELPNNTRILANGRRVGDGVLVPGTALSLVARARLGRFEAQQIDVDAPLIGTLTRQGADFAINGTTVRMARGLPATNLIGRRVVAHGLWQPDRSLRASLLQMDQTGVDSIAGVVEGSREAGWRIGQTTVQPAEGQILISGQFAVATGAFARRVLSASDIKLGRFRGGQALRQLAIEGYLEPVTTAPGFRISGLGHSFDRRLALDPFANLRALYFGPYDGRFRAVRAVVLPENPGTRQALLQPGDGVNFAAGLTGAASRAVTTRQP